MTGSDNRPAVPAPTVPPPTVPPPTVPPQAVPPQTSRRGGPVATLFQRREQPVREFAEQAGEVAAACYQMAIRFHRGGKLVVFGIGGSSPDAQHVAVEFVHPVIVGKRALPAIALTSDVATVTGIAARSGMAAVFSHQLRYLAQPADIALGISADGNCESVLSGLLTARDLGMLTIALVGGDGGAIAASPAVDHLLITKSSDPRVVKEMHVTSYHVLWELVHVFFEQPGVLAPGVVS
jgi:D-sedoheptulose 7-phosphate isomerase